MTCTAEKDIFLLVVFAEIYQVGHEVLIYF